jgi:hypothetical protein
MKDKSRPKWLDRRDEVLLVIFAVLIPLLAIPAMLGA